MVNPIRVILLLFIFKVSALAARIEGPTLIGNPEFKEVLIVSAKGPVVGAAVDQKFTLKVGASTPSQTLRFVWLSQEGIYWLGLIAPTEAAPPKQFFLIDHKLVAVSGGFGETLSFYTSSAPLLNGPVNSFALSQIKERLKKMIRLDIEPRTVLLEDILGRPPFRYLTSGPGVAPVVESVSVSSGTFEVTLKGGKMTNIEAKIIFKNDFRPLSATVEGRPVYPR